MQLEVGGDYSGGKLGVSGRAGAGAPDSGGDVVKFFAILLGMFQRMWVGMGHERPKTLSATIGPEVARVSAAMTTPPSNVQPTMVVPVLVALGKGTP